MNVLVIRNGRISDLPPAMSLVSALIDLGANVTLLASGTDALPNRIRNDRKLEIIDLGLASTFQERITRQLSVPNVIRRTISERKKTFDFVWTTSDTDARDAGNVLLECNHIMQLPELIEYTPAITQRPFPIHSQATVDLARHAYAVVVPEYNRAHIQRTVWELPRRPIILPNKPYPDPVPTKEGVSQYAEIGSVFAAESRRILLYQGAIGPDRNLRPFVDALDNLGPDYVLYAMGKTVRGYSADAEKQLEAQHDNFKLLGYVPAPGHLSFTPFGYIGLMPYKPNPGGRNSLLNALYCAPNKIWEYSRFGIPMLGSDVPGLTNLAHTHGFGLTVSEDPNVIAQAVEEIRDNYAHMSACSERFYRSLDYRSAVADILGIGQTINE